MLHGLEEGDVLNALCLICEGNFNLFSLRSEINRPLIKLKLTVTVNVGALKWLHIKYLIYLYPKAQNIISTLNCILLVKSAL